MGKASWHNAAEANNTVLLELLWVWHKEELTTEKLNNQFLLAKDDTERTA